MIYLVIIAIAVLTHINWFRPDTILTFGDFGHRVDATARQLADYERAWSSLFYFGRPNPVIHVYPLNWLMSFLTNCGLSSDNANKIIIFIPTAIIGFVGPYLLFRHLTKDKSIAFIGALFYGSTTYFLIKEAQHVLLGFGYAICPLVLSFFITALETNRLRSWLNLTVIFTVAVYYEIRIALITLIILLAYFFFFYLTKLTKYFRNIILAGIIVVLLNLYWLLPLAIPSYQQDLSLIIGRPIWGNALFDVAQALTIHESGWTGGPANWSFVRQPIPSYLWFIPIMIVIPLIYRRSFSQRKKRQLLFFLFLALVGIFLTKQSSHPFTITYQWLYDHLPGFNFFREASKLFQLTAIGYGGLLVFALSLVRRHKWLFYCLAAGILLVVCLNLKPLATLEIDALFAARSIPKDYVTLEKTLAKDNTFFRTLMVPSSSHWFPESQRHQVPDMANLVVSEWREMVQLPGDNAVADNADFIRLLEKPYSDNLLDMSSIRYVLVPADSIDKKDFDFFVSRLDRLPYLKKVDLGTTAVAIYENANFRPYFYKTAEKISLTKNGHWQPVAYEQINSGIYKIHLGKVNQPFYLHFSELYDPGWQLSGNSDHFPNEARMNTFYIDPQKTCRSGNDCELALNFKAERYFQIGWIISATTLIICLLTIFFITIQ